MLKLVARLAGKVAVVSGASRGAGRGIAVALGSEGATVYVTGRTRRGAPVVAEFPHSVEDTAEEVREAGGVGIGLVCDHTDDEQVRAVFDRIRADHGRLDVLVEECCVPIGHRAGGGAERHGHRRGRGVARVDGRRADDRAHAPPGS